MPYNHELLCTRVDTALVITSGKTLFPVSALFGLQHEDTFNIDQGRYAYAYAFEANLLEAILLVAYFTKKGVVKIKEQRSHIDMLVLSEYFTTTMKIKKKGPYLKAKIIKKATPTLRIKKKVKDAIMTSFNEAWTKENFIKGGTGPAI